MKKYLLSTMLLIGSTALVANEPVSSPESSIEIPTDPRDKEQWDALGDRLTQPLHARIISPEDN